MSLEFILDPPDKPKSKSSFSIIHRMATVFEFIIEGISIEFVFPKISTTTKASAELMKVTILLSENDSQGLVAAIEFTSNLVTIHQNKLNLITLQYAGNHANIEVDVNIPTMMMNVTMKLSGQDMTTVQTQLFLEFFGNFQEAEDNSIEMKMAYGFPTGGKMKHLQVNLNEMLVCIQDNRSPIQTIMKMELIQVELSTTRTGQPAASSPASSPSTASSPPALSSKWCDPYETCDFEKLIAVQISSLSFLGVQNCSVGNIQAKILKKVKNSGNFIDSETVTAVVESVNFQYISNLFLDCLLILQNLADSVPSSRFGHNKTSQIHATVQHINSAIAPSDHLSSIHFKQALLQHSHEDTLLTTSWNPVTHLFSQFISRKFLRIHFVGLVVTKFEDPETSPPTNDAALTFRLLDIVTNLRYADLEENYFIQLQGEEQQTQRQNQGQGQLEGNLAIVYEIIDGQAKFSLGEEFQLHSVDVREVSLIENSYSFPRHSSSDQRALVDPMTTPEIATLLTQQEGVRFLKLFHIVSLHIEATPELMKVTTEQLNGTIGLVSILKCQATVEMITTTQKRVTGKMDHLKETTAAAAAARAATVTGGEGAATAAAAPNPDPREKPPVIEKCTILIFKTIRIDLSLTLPNQENLFLHLYFENLINSDQGEWSKLEWSQLTIFANNDKQNEFVMITKFLLEKDVISTMKRRKIFPNSANLFSEVDRLASRQQKRMETTKISMEDIEIRFNPAMNLSPTLDCLLAQKDCYTNATSKKKQKELQQRQQQQQQQQKEQVEGAANANSIQESTLLEVEIGRFTFNVDVTYNETLYSSFAVFLWKEFAVSLENDLTETEIQKKIQGMDTNSLRPMNYSGITGGKATISWSELSLTFTLMRKRYLYGENIRLEGDLFLASVLDERIAMQSKWIGLSDAPSAANESILSPLLVIKGEVKDSAAPTKVYSNCTMTLNELSLFVDVETDSMMSSFLAAIDQSIPPNKDLVSPPLPWWDSIRYWTHGFISFVIKKMTYSISRMTQSHTPLKLDIIIHTIYLSINRSLVELEGFNYLINATYPENNVMSAKRRDNLSMKSSPRPTKKTELTVWRLCSIPSLSLSLAHTTSATHTLLYDHHDVYLSPAHVYYKDRFHYFRMVKNCSRWGIHMTCPDTVNNGMMLSLKLDVIQKIMSAFASNETTSQQQQQQQSQTSTNTQQQQSNGMKNTTPAPQRRSSTITLPPITSLPECISSLDIHLTMDNLLACSWPNSTNLYGIAFFQDMMRLDIRLCDPVATAAAMAMAGGVPVSTPPSSSSLQLESIEGNIENCDVYVREWKITSKNKTPSSSTSSSSSSSSCLVVADIAGLFEPIYKLAHASKVILKYQEESLDSSHHEGNIREYESSYPSHRTSICSSISSVTLRDKLIYKPSILSFRANHSAFIPPYSSLPAKQSSKKTSTHALDLLSRPLLAHLAQKRTNPTSSSLSSSSSRTRHDPVNESHLNNNQNNKMWDLKVVDIRLLWTISLRDMLANYAGRCSDLFKSNNSSEGIPQQTIPSVASHDEVLMPSRDFTRSVSLDESQLPSRQNSSFPSPSKPSSHDPTLRLRSPVVTERNPLEDDGEMDQILTISVPTNMRNRAMTKRHSGEIDLSTYYLDNSKPDLFATNQLSGDLSHSFVGSALTSAENKKKRRGNRRLSLRDKNINVEDSFTLEIPEENCDSPISQLRNHSPLKPSLSSSSPLGPLVPSSISSSPATSTTSRMLNRSSSVDNSLLTPSKSLGASSHSSHEELKQHSYRNQFQSFFSIELQDPQVNILDDKTQSTLLIVVDGSSTLIGKKHNGATVTLQGLGDQEKESPKRKVNVRLKMENVNAYTIATSSENMTNVVNWKALGHTEVGNQQRSRTKPHHTRSSTNEKFVTADRVFVEPNTSTSNPSSSTSTSTSTSTKTGTGNSTSTPSTAPTTSSTSTTTTTTGTTSQQTKNSSLNQLRNAIHNFEMIAVYTYYEDLSDEEAATLYTHRTREELMNSFMLDLPQVCLKVDSLQFSILLSTIRNVLLAPPPAQSENTSIPDEDESQVKRGVIRMTSTDGVIPSLNTRVGRAQIKNTVDQNILVLPENEFCTAQSVEYFIGRGTWQMCAPNSTDVLLEVGFMGLFGSHSFHEDRSSSTIFEVQRFWVRDTICSQIGNEALVTKKSQPRKGKNDEEDRTGWVLMPVLSKEGACKRCKKKFDVTKDSASSCCCHVDSEGADGQFREMTVLDSFGGYQTKKCWTCCRQTDVNAPGCLTRPHVCKELMLSIRAESGIPAAISDIDLTIFQTLEISVFPGCEYCIHVQISSQVLEMLHNYFEISGGSMNDEDDVVGEVGTEARTISIESTNGGATSGDRKNSKEDEHRPGFQMDRSSSLRGPLSNADSSMTSTDSNYSPKFSKQNSFCDFPSPHDPSTPRLTSISSTATAADNSPPPLDPSAPSTLASTSGPSAPSAVATPNSSIRQEALFIKYLRVGHIVVEVNTKGFAFNLEKYKAVVNEFSLRNKVLDWHRLIWKLEMHIALSMTSQTATSSMNKLWTIFFGRSAEEREQNKGINRYHDDDTMTKKILLLGE